MAEEYVRQDVYRADMQRLPDRPEAASFSLVFP